MGHDLVPFGAPRGIYRRRAPTRRPLTSRSRPAPAGSGRCLASLLDRALADSRRSPAHAPVCCALEARRERGKRLARSRPLRLILGSEVAWRPSVIQACASAGSAGTPRPSSSILPQAWTWTRRCLCRPSARTSSWRAASPHRRPAVLVQVGPGCTWPARRRPAQRARTTRAPRVALLDALAVLVEVADAVHGPGVALPRRTSPTTSGPGRSPARRRGRWRTASRGCSSTAV